MKTADFRLLSTPLLLLALVASLPAAPVCADGMALWRQRADLTEQFSAAITSLADEVATDGDNDAAAQVRSWLRVRDPDKIYLYHATSAAVGALNALESDGAPQWRCRLATLRRDQADALFELAQSALRQGDYSLSYELTLDALRENPDHEQARRILGFQQHDGHWRTTFDVRQMKLGRVDTPEFGWLPSGYVERYQNGERRFQNRWMSADEERQLRRELGQPWRVVTEHYTIDTSHSLEAGVRLGRRLERLYNVWRRVFVRYYANDAELEQLFTGRRSRRGDASPQRMRVVFYADREQYQHALRGQLPPGIETTGYYWGEQRTAFFFGSPEPDYRTLYHEATHQLFSESRPTVANVASAANFWIVEGIACYMESLAEADDYTTLGGNDIRLQAARQRRLVDDYYVPLGTLVEYGMEQLQRDPDIRRIYSESSGLTHFLIHAERGRYRGALVDYLRLIYSGRDRPSALGELTGRTFSQLDEEYRTFLEDSQGS
ncbi:MAG: hypothetical protein KDA63_17640 [Planctomycetales bacterium]|nr:hypothetical protein [Planctomycetales bacterium]